MRFNIYNEIGEPFDNILGGICDKEIRRCDYFKHTILSLVRFLNFCYYDETQNYPLSLQLNVNRQNVEQKTFNLLAEDEQRCIVSIIENKDAGKLKVRCFRKNNVEIEISPKRVIRREEKLDQTIIFDKNKDYVEFLTKTRKGEDRKIYNLTVFKHEDLLIHNMK